MLRRALQAAGILGACVLAATGFACSQGVAEPPGATRIDYGMPARLGRQVAPAPSTPWPSPELREYTRVLKAAEPASLDLQKRYDLVELIDLAQRLNPETRVAWEAARQAAIGVGLVESAYFPVSRRSRSRGSRKRSPYEGMTTEAMVLLCAREICSYLLLLCVIFV